MNTNNTNTNTITAGVEGAGAGAGAGGVGGAGNPRARVLSLEEVAAIHRTYWHESGPGALTQAQLADKYRVSQSTISRVVKGTYPGMREVLKGVGPAAAEERAREMREGGKEARLEAEGRELARRALVQAAAAVARRVVGDELGLAVGAEDREGLVVSVLVGAEAAELGLEVGVGVGAGVGQEGAGTTGAAGGAGWRNWIGWQGRPAGQGAGEGMVLVSFVGGETPGTAKVEGWRLRWA